MTLYGMLESLNDIGEKAVMVTVVDKKGEGPMPLGGRMLVRQDGSKEGTIGGGAIEREAIRQSLTMFDGSSHAHITYDLSGKPSKDKTSEMVQVSMVCGGEVTLFYELSAPKTRVIVFGGGNVGSALVEKLKGTCLKTILCDPAITDGQAVGTAEALEMMKPIDMVVIATGTHEIDAEILWSIMSRCKPNYIGMLASKKKVDEIRRLTVARESADEFSDMMNGFFDSLHSPIGLDIGGNSPDEIAISIAAQLLAKHHGKKEVRDLHR